MAAIDHFLFEHDSVCVLDAEMTMHDARIKAFELAEDQDVNIQLRCYNELMHRWEQLGIFCPDGIMTNSFGETCRLSSDGRNLRRVNKL